jgi:hypothetical protein
MPIKNAGATKAASHYIAKVQDALIKHGAVGIQMMFDTDRRISGIMFALPNPTNTVQNMSFSLPCEWRRFQAVLKEQKVSRWREDEYCYRVAWANLKDWIEAQMALYETQMVSMPQIFLPFIKGKNGLTLFEQVANNPEGYLMLE